MVVECKGLIEELKKQVEEIAAKQKQSEAKFRCHVLKIQREGSCHIMELEKKVQRQNIVIKKLKALLGAVEVQMKERVSEMEELEATSVLEEELKEIRPELEEAEVMEQQNMLLQGQCARCHGSYMRWEQSINDSRRLRQTKKAIKEEKAELRRKKKFTTEYQEWDDKKKRLKQKRKRAQD